MLHSLFLRPVRRLYYKLSARQRRGALVACMAVSFTTAVGAFVMHPPEIEDLSEEHSNEVPNLLTRWKEGDVIVLLRHLERCDKEDYPCLEGTEGITSRSVPMGGWLAEGFGQLGLAKTDVYNSPLTRTAQTEELVFNDLGIDKDWLYKCRETMLKDALEHKMPGKNMVLVTHSSCISAFEQSLGYDTETPEYGTAVFFTKSADSDSLKVVGFLEADDWKRVLDNDAWRQRG
ncbi:Lipopolysaccharide core heptose(II)-phosphate phosphatase [Pseudomonas sp. Bi70]|uniref:lipopolysaccharide core heptose(II)-phosphate phosphatase PmrG n=1 Tax=Pseudomonas sp. Bi70 TaxID=2821127 RepID=UPI001DC241A2|nr:histidine phosphatase family protein [Pseudomonas sp. Bi70]CAH0270222.1 Lipopolysaccharide core heptose(II)-phosphate phosphatase [Pseudomonas sp. Bi70]